MIRGSFGVIRVIRARWNHYVFYVTLGTTDSYYNIKKEKGGAAAKGGGGTRRAGRSAVTSTLVAILEFYTTASVR